jgi:hypothetical protein
MQKSKYFLLLIFLLCGVLFSQWDGPHPTIDARYLSATKHFQHYDVILEPDKNEPDWWAGAPSVARDDNGFFWLACRMRTANSPRGLRGYEIRLLRSEDGVHFIKIKSILREQVPILGFERPALLFDKTTKKFKLYACGPFQDGPWCIIKFDDVDNPADFDPSTARAVIEAPQKKYARDVSVLEYKDPFIIQANGEFHCYVTGYVRRNERLFHFKSSDGESWRPVGDVNQPVMDLNSWHNFFIRPASVLPLGLGWLFIYEGSSTQWYDPVYNIGTGFGFTFDLHNITDLTTDSPIALSTTPGKFYTFRYSHWLWVDGDIWVYAEAARENNSNEVRLFKIKVESQ